MVSLGGNSFFVEGSVFGETFLEKGFPRTPSQDFFLLALRASCSFWFFFKF